MDAMWCVSTSSLLMATNASVKNSAAVLPLRRSNPAARPSSPSGAATSGAAALRPRRRGPPPPAALGVSAAVFSKEKLLEHVMSAVPQGISREDWLQALPRALVAGFVKTDIDFQRKVHVMDNSKVQLIQKGHGTDAVFRDLEPPLFPDANCGAAIRFFDHAIGINVPRSRFLPVKATSDLQLVQGKVTITAKPGVKLEIPDGAVIENKDSTPEGRNKR